MPQSPAPDPVPEHTRRHPEDDPELSEHVVEHLAWRHERLRTLPAVHEHDWAAVQVGFERAKALVRDEHAPDMRLGFTADIAHAQWLAGDEAAAFAGFATALIGAEGLTDTVAAGRLMDIVSQVLAGLNRLTAGESVPDGERIWPGACTDHAYVSDHPAPTALAWLQLLRLEERRGGSTLYDAHRRIPESAGNPLVRWYMHRLSLRKHLRTGTLESALPVAVAAGRAFRAVRLAPDGDPTAATIADSTEPLDLEALAFAVIPPLMACLIHQGGDRAEPGDLVAAWLDDAVTLAPEIALQAWLNAVLMTLRLTVGQAWDLIQDPDQSLDLRVLAGACLLSAPAVMPSQVFFAHCLIVLWAARPDSSQGAILLQEGFSRQVAALWLRLSASRVTLSLPDVTAPAIAAACAGQDEGWQTVRRILLTAQTAVDVRLSGPVLDALIHLTGERVPEPAGTVSEDPPQPAGGPPPQPD